MRAVMFPLAKFLAGFGPLILLVGGTAWFCDRLVGNSDPIMHPFIYCGPIALGIGAIVGWVCVATVADLEARSKRGNGDGAESD